ncbi:MAG: hypothetical protein PHD95_03470 [Candidatus ainarchaeum sp.]|nr:hypothetical protein [Candidatus ainarchaeum sp.]
MVNEKGNVDLLLGLLGRLLGTDSAFVTSVFERLITEETYTFKPGEMNEFKGLAAKQLSFLSDFIQKKTASGNIREAEKAKLRYSEIQAALRIRKILEQYSAALYKKVTGLSLNPAQKWKADSFAREWAAKGFGLNAAATRMGPKKSGKLLSKIKVSLNGRGEPEMKPESLPGLKGLCNKIILFRQEIARHQPRQRIVRQKIRRRIK